MRKPTLIVPIGCYLAVTLGLPLLNGAAAGESFLEHAFFVLAVCTVMLLLRQSRSRPGMVSRTRNARPFFEARTSAVDEDSTPSTPLNRPLRIRPVDVEKLPSNVV